MAGGAEPTLSALGPTVNYALSVLAEELRRQEDEEGQANVQIDAVSMLGSILYRLNPTRATKALAQAGKVAQLSVDGSSGTPQALKIAAGAVSSTGSVSVPCDDSPEFSEGELDVIISELRAGGALVGGGKILLRPAADTVELAKPQMPPQADPETEQLQHLTALRKRIGDSLSPVFGGPAPETVHFLDGGKQLMDFGHFRAWLSRGGCSELDEFTRLFASSLRGMFIPGSAVDPSMCKVFDMPLGLSFKNFNRPGSAREAVEQAKEATSTALRNTNARTAMPLGAFMLGETLLGDDQFVGELRSALPALQHLSVGPIPASPSGQAQEHAASAIGVELPLAPASF
eukprot:6205414-Pleurochrysis_carterae.AAC.1